MGLDRNLLHGLDISFKGHPVITYRLREQINVDTTFESEDFVFERDSGSGRSLLRGKIHGLRIQGQSNKNNQLPMTRWVKLENCQWAFGEEKTLEWLSKFGKPLTPLEEETYNFGSNNEDDCQDAVGTGNLSAKMTIEQEIPQFLPMMGQKVRVYYRGITKLCINCYQPGHIKKNCKNSTVGWIDYVQKFKEEHDFSDELYGNWIKILGLNQVRKEKEKQRRQHLEDVRNQKEGEKATTQDEEENVEPEEESLPENLRGKRLPTDSEEQPQPSRVEKPRENQEKSANQEKAGQNSKTSNQKSQELENTTESEKRKEDDKKTEKSIPRTKRFVLGKKKLDSA